MSTPRPHTINPATDRCVMCGMNDFRRAQFPNCPNWNEVKPEGVAAPLEPSAEEFWQKVNCFPKDILPKLSLFDCQKLDEIIVEAMEAYAAAVSKNLREELAEIRQQRDSAQSNVAEWKDLVKLQRKEITALRETK